MIRRRTDRYQYRKWLFRLFIAWILVYVVATILTSLKAAAADGEMTCTVASVGDSGEVSCPDGTILDIPLEKFMCSVRPGDNVILEWISDSIYMAEKQPDCDKHNHFNRPPN